MAKVDKDTLIKNRFWIMLAAAVLLLLVCWLVLLLSSAGADQQKKYEAMLKKVQDNAKQQPKNMQWKTPWEVYGKTFTDQKEAVWKKAWDKQADMYIFPADDPVARWTDVRYYDDEVGPDSNEARKHYAKDEYHNQFKGLDKFVAPVEFNGGEAGFAQIMGPAGGSGGAAGSGGKPNFLGKLGGIPGGPPGSGPGKMSPSAGPGGGPNFPGMPGGGSGAPSGGTTSIDSVFASGTVPTMEEIWLAQEDFWVKREMLKIIREALDTYSRFTPVPIPDSEPMPDKVLSRHRFRNPTWEITLLIEQTQDKGAKGTVISSRSTIKNVNATRRTQLVANARTGLGLKFLVQQNGANFPFTVEGEPLPFGDSLPFKKTIPVDSITFTKPFGVQQALEYATSPIRRIDELRTAENSSRLAVMPLKYNQALYKEPPKPESGAENPAPGGTPGSGPSGPGDMRPSGPGGPGAAASSTAVTNAGLLRERYILTNDQCRHLPIAMVLIVDQAAANDVLIAVANSRLKIQITQVNLVHVHDPGPAATDETTVGGTQPFGPGEGSFPGPKMRPGVPPGMFGPFPPGTGPGSFSPADTEVNGEDNNLFELSVYGVATLYERFPKREPKPATKDGTP
jgi:hypothetical protein